jgi:hypothetical protein
LEQRAIATLRVGEVSEARSRGFLGIRHRYRGHAMSSLVCHARSCAPVS